MVFYRINKAYCSSSFCKLQSGKSNVPFHEFRSKENLRITTISRKGAGDNYRFHKICEAAIHKNIDEEMRSHLVYTVMAAHFNHNSVARKGFASFFASKAKSERDHAQKLIDYLNLRGGRFAGFDIKMPVKFVWSDGLEALQDALNLEKHVNNKLHHLHDLASAQCTDQHLMDFLESDFFDEKVKSINQLHNYISKLTGMSDDMGEFLFDGQLSNKKTEL